MRTSNMPATGKNILVPRGQVHLSFFAACGAVFNAYCVQNKIFCSADAFTAPSSARRGCFSTNRICIENCALFGEREMTSRYVTAGALLALVLAQTGCGGGGGSGESNATAESLPALPAQIDAAKVRLAQLSAPCFVNSNPRCLGQATVEINASGEFAAFWYEKQGATLPQLKAANVALGGAAPLSQGLVQQFSGDFAFTIKPMSDRRFLLTYATSGDTQGARVVDMGTSGSPLTSTGITGNGFRYSMPVVRNLSGKLYAVDTSGSTAVSLPFPKLDLGNGVDLTLVSVAQRPFATTFNASVVDYQSVANRSIWGTIGQEQLSSPRHVYTADIELDTGNVLPLNKFSMQPVVSSAKVCTTILSPQVRSTGVGYYSVAWTQQNELGTYCPLWVSGRRVSAETSDVNRFAVTGKNDTFTAVWDQWYTSTGTKPALYFSQYNPVSTQWSEPQLVSPTYAGPNDQQRALAIVTGPDNTAAVYWEWSRASSSQPGTYNLQGYFVSKLVNGTWTTKTVYAYRNGVPTHEYVGMAINAAGDAVLLMQEAGCAPAAPSCLQLNAYRF